MAGTVRIRRDGPIAVIAVDHPPANVVTMHVRRGLIAALGQAAMDDKVKAIVLGTARHGFAGQINPKEYDVGIAKPDIADVTHAIEVSDKPVVALVSGEVSGPGAEFALAAHARVATPESRIGFVEMNYALIPHGGATQRLPRLIGARHTLSFLLSGRLFPASSETASGLFDAIVPSAESEAEAARIALELAGRGFFLRTSERTEGFEDPGAYQSEISARRKSIWPGERPVSAAVFQAVESAPLFTFDAGMALERDLFDELVITDRSRGMRHAAIAELRVGSGIHAEPVALVGIFRTGLGAARLAASLAESGISVVLSDPDAEARNRFDAALRENLDGRARRAQTPAEVSARMLESVVTVAADEALSAAEVIIDLSDDDEGAKATALAAIVRVAEKDAVVLSRTRYLDVAALAPEGMRNRVLGFHLPTRSFPARLAELAATRATKRTAQARARRLMQQIGRIAVRAAPSDGLIGPAVAGAMFDACDALVRLGANPTNIDIALKRRGFARGPYQLLSEMDGDAHAQRQDRRGKTNGLSCLIVRAGLRLGSGTDREVEKAALTSLTAEARHGHPTADHPWSEGEIWTAVMAAMVNESARLLERRVASRPLAIDVAMIQGYGFPRSLGGPMMAADMMGLFTLVRAMQALAPLDRTIWEPHPRVLEIQRNGESLDSLNG